MFHYRAQTIIKIASAIVAPLHSFHFYLTFLQLTNQYMLHMITLDLGITMPRKVRNANLCDHATRKLSVVTIVKNVMINFIYVSTYLA